KVTVPVDAENWISHMEKIFDVMGCEDAFKTRLAVYKFEGDALAWWKAYKQAKAAGTAEEQAKDFQWGLRKSTLNHLMCIPFMDVAQIRGRGVVIGIIRPLDRVVTGTTVIIMTVMDQTGEAVVTTTA
nr:hypothetical protein [Tanacetum cinerariifolium]